MKKMKNLYKSLLSTVIALSLVAGLGIAGLLQYYGKVVGTATVSQSVQVSADGVTWLTCIGATGEGCTIEDTYFTTAGNTQYNEYYIKNNAEINASIKIDDEDTPEEVEMLEVAVVDLDTNCSELGDEDYSNIKGPGNEPVSTSLDAGETKKICEKVKFAINTQAGDYNVTIAVSPENQNQNQ